MYWGLICYPRLLGIYPEETKTEKDTCIPLFIAALFTVAGTWKQPRCPLTLEWIKKLWYIYTMEYQFSSVGYDNLQPQSLQHGRLPCPSLTSGIYSNSCPLSQWCHPTISSSVDPSPSLNLSHHQDLFKWVSSLHQVAKVLEFQIQHQSFQWTPGTNL